MDGHPNERRDVRVGRIKGERNTVLVFMRFAPGRIMEFEMHTTSRRRHFSL